MGVVVSYFSDSSVSKSKSEVKVDFMKPTYYGRLEGPLFTTLDYNKSYSTKHYACSLLVSTIVYGELEECRKIGISRLEKYFKGHNLKEWRLPKTCPVLVKKYLKDEESNVLFTTPLTTMASLCNKYTVSFPVPQAFSDDAPGPTNTDVFLEQAYKRIHYVSLPNKNFSEDSLQKDIDELEERLQFNNETYESDYCFVCFYTITTNVWHKTKLYEIWFHGTCIEEDYKVIHSYSENENEEKEK